MLIPQMERGRARTDTEAIEKLDETIALQDPVQDALGRLLQSRCRKQDLGGESASSAPPASDGLRSGRGTDRLTSHLVQEKVAKRTRQLESSTPRLRGPRVSGEAPPPRVIAIGGLPVA
jgi:hypothetical protein